MFYIILFYYLLINSINKYLTNLSDIIFPSLYNTIQIKAINIAELTSHDINQIIII